VQVPVKLSSKARALLEEVSRLEGENTSPVPISLAELRS